MNTVSLFQPASNNATFPSFQKTRRFVSRKRIRLLLSYIFVAGLFLVSCGKETVAGDSTYVEGHAMLVYNSHSTEHSEAYLDLDTGDVLNNADADIALIVSGGTTLFNVLQPTNGAKVRSMGLEEMSLENCRQRIESLSTHNIPEVTAGNHLCVLTNQGRLAILTIDEVVNLAPGVSSIQVRYVIEFIQHDR